MEGYLDTISNRSNRVCYSKMRISNHRFAIETGRIRKIPRDKRCCLFFKEQSIAVIEDEKHILLHFPLYEQYRKQLYGSVDGLCPNFKDLENGDQLNYLLNSDGPIVKAVARFFYLANLMHSCVNMNKYVYILSLCLSFFMSFFLSLFSFRFFLSFSLSYQCLNE